MTPICYTGPYADASGYGEANRNFIMAFREAGANIKTQKVSFTGSKIYDTHTAKICHELSQRDIPYQIKILHVTPDTYKSYIEKGKYNIGHLVWETNVLPKAWVAPCNMMDEIWTTTDLTRNAIINSGVKVPVHVFPEPIDIDIPDVRPFKLPNFNGVIFLSVFDWVERKNPRVLVDAFWKEFKGIYDVALLIKTHKSTYSDSGVAELLTELKSWKNQLGFKDTPRVFVSTNLLNEEEKRRLYKTCSVYVSTSRGEGWNIPIVEAGLYRKPIICTDWGGVAEYFPYNAYFHLDYDLVPIDKIYNKYYEPGMLWAGVKESSLRVNMRKVYYQLTSGKQNTLPNIKTSKVYNIISTQFNYKAVGELMLKRLKELETRL